MRVLVLQRLSAGHLSVFRDVARRDGPLRPSLAPDAIFKTLF